MKKVAFHTFGCRTNQEETGAFMASFRDKGYTVVQDPADADILVVNTCSVTGQTESKVKRYIKSMGAKYEHLELVLTGCLAQQVPQELNAIKGVKLVIGNEKKKDLPDLVVGNGGGIFVEEITAESAVATPDVIESPLESNRTRFSVKLQEGCNHVCSYCIVPALRGPSRSVPLDEVVDTAKRAADAGYREIVLTGTHIGQFRDGSLRFIDLIQAILDADPRYRIRLSSMNSVDCTDELFELMVKEPRICRHLHVSAQALSVDMLTIMKRAPHGMERLLPRLTHYRKLMPELTIGGDFIVGMPGETEQIFRETADRLELFGFSYGHVFKYSPRPGTTAAEQPDQIPESVKESRSKILRDKLEQFHEQFVQSLIGYEMDIITEKEGSFTGISGNYLRFADESLKASKNRVVTCKIEGWDYGSKSVKFSMVEP